MLGAAARGRIAAPDGFEPAATRYAATIRDDDDDVLLARTAKALASCATDPCAQKVLDTSPFGPGPLVAYEDRLWSDRSVTVQTAVEFARAALGAEELVPLMGAVADDLAVSWPDAVPVDLVVEAPPPARRALLPIALAAKGSCFLRGDHADGAGHERVYTARIIDCVLVHATVSLSDRSRLFAALNRELPVVAAERAWELAVVHGVAAAIGAWEPHHESVYRRAAEPADGPMLKWLAENWKWRASGEPVEAFAARYAAAFESQHADLVAKGERAPLPTRPGATLPRPSAPEPAAAPPSSSSAPPPPAGACSRDDDCPLVMSMHPPCCLQADGTGHCSTLPPKTDACPDEHLCVVDADCRAGAKCASDPATGKKTCKGAARPGGRVMPGECYNRPPNSPPLPQCGDKP